MRPSLKTLIALGLVAGLAILALAGCTSGGSSASSSSSASSTTSSSASSQTTSSSSASSASSSSAATVTDAPTANAVLPESEWGDFFATMGTECQFFGIRVLNDLPVKAKVQWSGEGGGWPIEFTDPGEIRALFNGLAAANMAGEATMVTTDDYTWVYFEFSDGATFSFNFDSMAVDLPNDGTYKEYNITISDDLAWFVAAAENEVMGR